MVQFKLKMGQFRTLTRTLIKKRSPELETVEDNKGIVTPGFVNVHTYFS